ncbi:MAG: hypothetical protein IJI66_09810 [Erysipelotrichaceae bacterium]|nr:hypothetical protein [Erysipelotrichaceae bacterium]
MTQITLTHRIEELNDLEQMIEELKAEAETIKDQIKQEMSDRGTDELVVGDYVIRYTQVLTSKFNTKSFKEDYLDLYKAYLKQTESRRFTISH